MATSDISIFPVRAASISEKVAQQVASQFSADVKRRREQACQIELRKSELLTKAYAPLAQIVRGDPGAFAALEELQLHLEAKKEAIIRAYQDRTIRHTTVTTADLFKPGAHPKRRVLSPPYDIVPFPQLYGTSDAATGSLKAAMIGGPQEVEGDASVGVFLTSSETVNVRIAGYMPIHFDWTMLFLDTSSASVSGGVEVSVYRQGQNEPVKRDEATLWEHTALFGASGHDTAGGYLGDTSCGQVTVTFKAAETYVVWFTVRAGAVTGSRQVFAASIVEAKIPFIVIDGEG